MGSLVVHHRRKAAADLYRVTVGEQKAVPQNNRCDFAVPLLHEADWAAMRAVMGW
jgi:hypothetical protein